MNRSSVIQKIIKCVNRLYKEDKYLFSVGVCERCLMFRLAHYLQAEFPDYFVDCEFNKRGVGRHTSASKVEPDIQGYRLKNMFADTIIHNRNPDAQDNFVCLEIKISRKGGVDSDVERLKRMTSNIGFRHEGQQYHYGYNFGFLIYLPKKQDRSNIRIFERGQESSLGN